ncbi:MAG: VWA domain-containing protein [Woeseiaceae bacterium]
MDQFISQLHFIRPEWFYAFIPLALISIILLKLHKQGKSWTNIIDAKLLPHLLVGQSIKKTSLNSVLVFIVGALVIISLAGPAWEKRPQPVFKDKSALVIALDLSSSMDAADIKPSRLTRAKHKIIDILKQRKLGQTALLVYAGSAYVVTPLTDDTATITSLLESLTTDIMPTQGTRTDKALSLAISLLKNADVRQGDILLVTDSIEQQAKESFQKISKQHRISILAVATPQGAPIPLISGGFLKDRRGDIVVPKLNISNFKEFNNMGNGRLSVLSADDSDIKDISALFQQSPIQKNKKSIATQLKTDSWYEQGPWLLLLIIPFAALAFRRGVLFVFVFLIIQQPQYVEASTFWDDLWQTADQQASKQLDNNHPAEAAKLFNNKEWQATSYYRNKQYQESIESLNNIDTADAHYNMGNAYAKLGENDKAIEEYNKSLLLNSKHKDALYNKQAIEKHKKQNPNKEQDKNKKNTSKDNKNNHKKDSGKNKSKDGKRDESAQQDNKKNKGGDKEDRQNKNKKPDNKGESEKDNEAKENKIEKEQQKYKDTKEKTKNKNKEPTESQKKKLKEQQATKQWLRRIPDDPGGLLRNKFNYQYKRQQNQQHEQNNW